MDINDKIAMHRGLIYKQLTTFNLLYDQDAESFAYEALHRAVLTFNENDGTAFSTYAVCCINNALRKHLRSLNKVRQLDIVSYDAPISSSDESQCMSDILEHPCTVEQTMASKEACRIILAAFSYEYSLLTPKHKSIIDLFYNENVVQKDIALSVGVTQATVSKVVSAFKYRVKLRMEEYK